jgi:hypothetical protein
VWQGAGVEGARRPPRPPSEATSLALAEALRRRSSQGWTFDVRRRRWRGRRCYRAGGYESRCWTARLEGGGRATRSVVVATKDDDDGWDLPPPPARPRWMRRCRCPLRPTTETTKTRARDDATRRDERGGGATPRDKRQATTARQGATLRSSRHCGDARGLVIYYEFEWEVGRSQIRIRSDSEQVFGRAEKNTRVILRPQTTLSYSSQKKQCKMM